MRSRRRATSRTTGRRVVGSLRTHEEVLAAHDVDLSAYTAEEPPEGLSADAREQSECPLAVGSQRTIADMAALEQHALDVCGTPLSR